MTTNVFMYDFSFQISHYNHSIYEKFEQLVEQIFADHGHSLLARRATIKAGIIVEGLGPCHVLVTLDNGLK